MTARAALAASAVANEFVAVAAVGERKERFTLADRARIDREAGDGCRQRALPLGAHRRRHVVDGPQRAARSCGKLLQCRGDRFVIAERYCPVADDLAGFMALAGDQKNIAGA